MENEIVEVDERTLEPQTGAGVGEVSPGDKAGADRALGKARLSLCRPAAFNAIASHPHAAIQAQKFRTPSYSESNLSGGGFGLYAAMNRTDARSELGGRFDDLTTFNAMPLILLARVA